MGKYVHLCPKCGQTGGFKMEPPNPNLTCTTCLREVTWDEWKNAKTILKPGYEEHDR